MCMPSVTTPSATSMRWGWSRPCTPARSRCAMRSRPPSPASSRSTPSSTAWRTPPTTGPASRPATRAAATSPAYRRWSRTTSTSPACRPCMGADSWVGHPAKKDGDFARMFLATGLIPLGKSQLSEYGYSAAAEHPRLGAVRTPWNTDHIAGASSAGSAALVAAGAVPIAHANDGGGSIRIPASVNGLVGLKPTRDRLAQDKMMRDQPIRIVSDGVVTRSVRDTAAFFREAEKVYRDARSAAGRRHHPPGPQAAPDRRPHLGCRPRRRRRGHRAHHEDRPTARGAGPHGGRGGRAGRRRASPTTSSSTGR